MYNIYKIYIYIIYLYICIIYVYLKRIDCILWYRCYAWNVRGMLASNKLDCRWFPKFIWLCSCSYSKKGWLSWHLFLETVDTQRNTTANWMSLPTPQWSRATRDIKKISRSTHGRTKKSEQKSTTPVMFLRAGTIGWQRQLVNLGDKLRMLLETQNRKPCHHFMVHILKVWL